MSWIFGVASTSVLLLERQCCHNTISDSPPPDHYLEQSIGKEALRKVFVEAMHPSIVDADG